MSEDRNDPEGNGHPNLGLVASAARYHVLYLWFAVAFLSVVALALGFKVTQLQEDQVLLMREDARQRNRFDCIGFSDWRPEADLATRVDFCRRNVP